MTTAIAYPTHDARGRATFEIASGPYAGVRFMAADPHEGTAPVVVCFEPDDQYARALPTGALLSELRGAP